MKANDALAASLWPQTMYGRAASAFARRLLPLLLLFALPAAVHAQFDYMTVDGTITIAGYTGPGGAVVIPTTINGLPVTRIGSSAFFGNSAITNVTIPNSVTSIGVYALYGCTGLTSIAVDPLNSEYVGLDGVLFNTSLTILFQYPGGKAGTYTIPNSVTSIGGGAFEGCAGLTSVTIPNSVTTIETYVFSGCSGLTSVTIPNSVTSIGGGAFAGCTGLTSVTIPNSVTRIGDGAFSFCAGLTSVTIPNSVTSIGDYAFEGCTGLTSVTIPNSATSIGESAFSGCTGLTGVTIGNSVTSIGDYAFSGCTELTSVTIGNSVTSIGWYAFYGCTGLTSVTIPNSVTTIGEGAFSGCTGLTGLYFQGPSPALQSPDSTFAGAEQVTVYYLPGSTGWGGTFGGRPTALWLPRVRTDPASFGVRNNEFGFDVSWAPGKIVVVEAAKDLANPVWSPLQTNTLTGDSIHFSDPQWTSEPARFYRLRTP